MAAPPNIFCSAASRALLLGHYAIDITSVMLLFHFANVAEGYPSESNHPCRSMISVLSLFFSIPRFSFFLHSMAKTKSKLPIVFTLLQLADLGLQDLDLLKTLDLVLSNDLERLIISPVHARGWCLVSQFGSRCLGSSSSGTCGRHHREVAKRLVDWIIPTDQWIGEY